MSNVATQDKISITVPLRRAPLSSGLVVLNGILSLTFSALKVRNKLYVHLFRQVMPAEEQTMSGDKDNFTIVGNEPERVTEPGPTLNPFRTKREKVPTTYKDRDEGIDLTTAGELLVNRKEFDPDMRE